MRAERRMDEAGWRQQHETEQHVDKRRQDQLTGACGCSCVARWQHPSGGEGGSYTMDDERHSDSDV